MDSRYGAILVLSGERGAGKTSACREAARLAAERGLSVGGVLCPSRRDGAGMALEIEVESAATGERRALASRERELGGPRWPPGGDRGFSFSEEGFAWALAILRADLGLAGRRGGTDLLVIDEIGPVELVLRAGFRPFLDEMGEAGSRGGLIVATVRPSLSDELDRLPPFAAARRLTVEAPTRGALPLAVAREASRLREKTANSQ